MKKFQFTDSFVDRHIGPREHEIRKMLDVIKVTDTEELLKKTIPENIRLSEDIELGDGISEFELLNELKEIAAQNRVYKSYIGLGYHSTFTPPVIQRNIFENPGWYTQYTPYQAEISQGRLEALINFQTMICDITALPLSNSSLLDEGTAAAEAMSMFFSLRKGEKKKANVFLVSNEVFPQTIDILQTRGNPFNIEVKIIDHKNCELKDDVFGLMVQYPSVDGEIYDYTDLFEKADEKKIFKLVAADLLSLTLLKPPGEFGADAVVGTTQRFGVPMGFGGPHAAYFATKDEYKRQVAGRIIGVSVDRHGKPAYRMALQTREQHIKRERATSNICTAQVLLAIMAGMYAVYHGADGLKAIAQRINNLTKLLTKKLEKIGISQQNQFYFDTIKLKFTDEKLTEKIKDIALRNKVNFRYIDKNSVGISIGETTQLSDIEEIVNIIAEAIGKSEVITQGDFAVEQISTFPKNLERTTDFLTHPVFNKYKSETEMMRYIKKLENKDLSLTRSMIPLGSCTMKLNAVSELYPVSWSEFANIHPFAPPEQTMGYTELFKKFEKQLSEITGFAGISLQPNSGAQGEYTGLMVIREYHKSRNEEGRDVVLIPSSAHGTNPASAVMAGGKVVIVECDKYGNIKLEDLKEKAEKYKENLSALMLTYPSTHGVFEPNVKEVCEVIHKNGGQVYLDGANMNAQVGYTHPHKIGADVCHLNLHKTFAIPHGGGGPGVGPIGVAEHLTPFLPGHSIININNEKSMTAVSAAPWGSASILPISYAYIRMMGTEGLKRATEAAIINANYIKSVLEPYFDVLYTGKTGFVGHELIFDMRKFRESANIEVEDIAKRLMDYGYHAPTVSFPVPGTLMVEPTESESKVELDRFCDAMKLIRREIESIENGMMDKIDNPLKNSPHTVDDIIVEEWSHPYSREAAVYPDEHTKENKFWPGVSRVDNAYGDRNLVCNCLPINLYEGE